MGGQVGVESRRGEGSVFHVEVMLDRASFAVRPRDDSRARLAGLHVLVIDGLEVNRTILRARMESFGMIVENAIGGPDGLARMAAAGKAGQSFDIVVTDHAMPDMDGVAVATAIRALPGGGRPHIVLASSLGCASNEPPTVDGWPLFDAHLIKPTRHQDLIDCLSGIRAKAPPGIARGHEPDRR